MFEYYSVDGTIEKISEEKAIQLMDSISSQWEDESTSFGQLYMGVYDWAFNENPFYLKIPHLSTGGEIPFNEKASEKFGFEIYGDCFLKL